jgi:hypothetical protein
MAHRSAAPAVDARTLRFRLGWSGDTSAGSRLLSRRKAALSDSDDPVAVEAHQRLPDSASGPEGDADASLRRDN